MTRKRQMSLAMGAVALSLAISGCSMNEPEPSETLTAPVEQPADSVESPSVTDPAMIELPPGSNALGVVTAGLLVASGDIDEALAQGQVTPSEVKYAVLAIEEGTLQDWRELAEAE